MLVASLEIVPPASEREARMDDPTRWCENDTGNETRLSGAPDPKRGPLFLGVPSMSDSWEVQVLFTARWR